MGVVNVTDDSFSDGGRYLDADRAVEQGLALAADGASIVDVGGESTRPGATRIDPQVETARIVPVIKELAAQGVTVSVDTMHAGVARAALENGASMVNDVSGGRADAAMADLLVEADVPWVLMHWRSVSAERPHQVPALSRRGSRGARRVDGVRRGRRCRRGGSGQADHRSRAWVSPSPAATTGRCCTHCRIWWPAASRYWSGRRANAFSAACWQRRTARSAHPMVARRPPRWCRLWPRCMVPGEFGYMTCEVRSMLSKWSMHGRRVGGRRWLIESSCAA